MNTASATAILSRVSRDEAPGTPRPVLAWAALGFALTVVAVFVYVAWFVSGDATRIGPGADPVPTRARVAGALFQVAGPVLATVVVASIVRRCIAQNRLILDAMILIGTSLAWWHDPLINLLRPMVFYNASLVNLGSWSEQIPGWFSPHGRYLPEPILMIGLSYVWMPLLLGMVGTRAMRTVRSRYPLLGSVGTFCAGWAAVFAIEVSLEVLATRTSLVGYPTAVSRLTLWAGTPHQLPLYGPVLWSLVLTSIGGLRFFLDSAGDSLPERGIDRVAAARSVRSGMRLFAVVGFVQLVAILGYDLPIIASGLHPGPTSTYPTYLRTRQCGPPTSIQCPAPGTPIVPR